MAAPGASRASRLELEPNPFEVSFQAPSEQPDRSGAPASNEAAPAASKPSQQPESPRKDASAPSGSAPALPSAKPSVDKGKEDPPQKQTAAQQSGTQQPPPSQSSAKAGAHPSTPARAGHSTNSGSVSSVGSAGGSASGSTAATAGPATTKALPGITALTSPADSNPFNWVTSLRDGPLSPAMLGAPSTSQQGFDVSAFRTGLTPDLSNFKTGLTPAPPGMSLPPTSPNTAAFLAMVSSHGAANVPSGTVTASGMLAITAPGSQSGVPAALTPNTINALTNAATNAQGGPNPTAAPAASDGSSDYFSGRGSAASATMDRPGSRLRNSVVSATEGENEGTEKHGVTPSRRSSRGYNPPGERVDRSAASGLYLLSQAHHELSKREGNAAAAQAAAQALQSIPYPSMKGGSDSSNRAGSKRKKPSPPPAASAEEGQDEAPSLSGGERGKRPPRGKKARADPKRGSRAKSSPDAESEEEKPGTARGSTEEEKRKNFLERNRQAALKCRQRKKAWLQSLQQTCEVLRRENESLTSTVEMLQQEVVYLRAQLVPSSGQAPPTSSVAQAHPTVAPAPAPLPGQPYLPPPPLGRDMFPPRAMPSHPGSGYAYGQMPPPPPPGNGFGQPMSPVDAKKIDVQ